MSEKTAGYACIPYAHDHATIEAKEEWAGSENIESMYFATASFAPECRPYFAGCSSHCILAKFADAEGAKDGIRRRVQEKPAFLFSTTEDLFEREAGGEMNFVSIYYLEYGRNDEDVGDMASVIARRGRIGRASVGTIESYSTRPPKFSFPYRDIVTLEVSSMNTHQGVASYCDKTRRSIAHRGINMNSLLGISILEALK